MQGDVEQKNEDPQLDKGQGFPVRRLRMLRKSTSVPVGTVMKICGHRDTSPTFYFGANAGAEAKCSGPMFATARTEAPNM